MPKRLPMPLTKRLLPLVKPLHRRKQLRIKQMRLLKRPKMPQTPLKLRLTLLPRLLTPLPKRLRPLRRKRTPLPPRLLLPQKPLKPMPPPLRRRSKLLTQLPKPLLLLMQQRLPPCHKHKPTLQQQTKQRKPRAKLVKLLPKRKPLKPAHRLPPSRLLKPLPLL